MSSTSNSRSSRHHFQFPQLPTKNIRLSVALVTPFLLTDPASHWIGSPKNCLHIDIEILNVLNGRYLPGRCQYAAEDQDGGGELVEQLEAPVVNGH